MRSVSIAELRGQLTRYFREVRGGAEIVVCEGRHPIAKIVPFTADDEDESVLVAAGLLRKAQQPLPAAFWRNRRSKVTVRKTTAALSEDRT